nr:hypothetical protein [Tanacetum cinerariifolium]
MGKGLFGPNGRRGGKVEVGFENFGRGRDEIGNCGGNGRRGSSIFGRGGGSLAICLIESKDGLGGGGLVIVGGRSSSVSKIAWGEVEGVENKSSMGSLLIAKGVTKSLLCETPGRVAVKNLELMEGPFDSRWVVRGLFGPNGEKGGKVEVGFDNFGRGGEEIGNCGDNGRRGSSIFRRGGGSLAICLIESKDGLGGGWLVVVGGRSSSVSKIAWGELEGVENKSLMGSLLIAKGEECLDGWIGACEGEVKGGGVDLGVTKSLLGETPGRVTVKNLELMEGPFDSRWVVRGDYKEGVSDVGLRSNKDGHLF